MAFYIIRHADKEWGNHYNPKLRHQDGPISQRGQEQAQKLIPYFADKGISRLYISAYIRTGQTVAPLAKHLGLQSVPNERLNEIDNNLLDGATEEEIQQKFPAEWQAYCERKTDFRFPEGETGRKRLNELSISWRRNGKHMGMRTLSSDAPGCDLFVDEPGKFPGGVISIRLESGFCLFHVSTFGGPYNTVNIVPPSTGLNLNEKIFYSQGKIGIPAGDVIGRVQDFLGMVQFRLGQELGVTGNVGDE